MRKPSAVAAPARRCRAAPAASRRRQPNGPARSAAVSSPAWSSTSRASCAARLVALGQALRQRPLAGEQVVRDRAPRAVLLDEMPVREHEPAVQRGDEPVDVLLRQPGQVAQLRAGQRALGGDRGDDRLLVRPRAPAARRRPTSSGSSRGATHVATRARCLPTQRGPAAGSSSFAPQRNPISSVQRTNAPVRRRARPIVRSASR